MRIGELAQRADVSVRSLRYYEEQGLLTSERSATGQRHYADGAVAQVALLKQLYAAGLTSKVIAEVLPCTHRPSIETNDAAFEAMFRERQRLREHIDGLSGTLAALDEILATNRRWRAALTDAASA